MNRPPRTWIAGLVSIAGVALIWGASAMHQDSQTRALRRRWLIDQWHIAHTCLVGDLPHGASEAAVQERLLLRLSHREAGWPAQCGAALTSLAPDDQEAHGALPAIHALQAQLPRVFEGDETAAAIRIRDLAEPIARIDAVMPR